MFYTIFFINDISSQSVLKDYTLITVNHKLDTFEVFFTRNKEGEKMYTKYYTQRNREGDIDTILYDSYVKKPKLLSSSYNGGFRSYYLSGELFMKGYTKYFKKYGGNTHVGKVTKLYKNGKIKTSYTYDFFGNPHGEILEYYDTGQLKIKTSLYTRYDTLPSRDYVSLITPSEHDSLKEIRAQMPIDSIRKNWVFTFVTSLSGNYTSFYKNGKAKTQGKYWFEALEKMSWDELIESSRNRDLKGCKNGYKYDIQDGIWTFWDGNGKLVKKETYEKGILMHEKKLSNNPDVEKSSLIRGNLYFFRGGEAAGNMTYEFK